MHRFRTKINKKLHERRTENYMRIQYDRPSTTEFNRQLSLELGSRCGTLMHLLQSTINTKSPLKVGTLLSVTENAIRALGILLVQNPTNTQVLSYDRIIHIKCCARLDPVGVTWSIDFHQQITGFLAEYRRRSKRSDPEHEELASTFLPMNSQEALIKARTWQERFTRGMMDTILYQVWPYLWVNFEKYDFKKMCKIYRQEKLGNTLPAPWLHLLQATEMPAPTREERRRIYDTAYDGGSSEDGDDWIPEDDELTLEDREETTAELPPAIWRSTGKPIILSSFSKRTSAPKDIDCVFCMDDVEGNWVVTQCKHFFHETCLDAWVNESAASSRNRCPLCRLEMCEARPRAQVV